MAEIQNKQVSSHVAVSLWTAEEERHESSSAAGELAAHQRPQVHQIELVAPKAPEGFSGTPLSDFGLRGWRHPVSVAAGAEQPLAEPGEAAPALSKLRVECGPRCPPLSVYSVHVLVLPGSLPLTQGLVYLALMSRD